MKGHKLSVYFRQVASPDSFCLVKIKGIIFSLFKQSTHPESVRKIKTTSRIFGKAVQHPIKNIVYHSFLPPSP